MKPAAFAYHAPRSRAELLSLLATLSDARMLAGGQSLVPLLNLRLAGPANLIDLNTIPELDTIAIQGDRLHLGAMVRQRAAEHSALVRQSCPLLAEALRHVGHQQTRNRGTIGGSLAHMDPTAEVPVREAMRHLIEVTFDYHAAHPEWVRLISVANIHDAQHIAASQTVASKNSAVLNILGGLLERGAAEGVFRGGLDPLHVHLLIASFCFYRMSNRHTWAVIFGRDLAAADETPVQRQVVVDAVLRFLAPDAVRLT